MSSIVVQAAIPPAPLVLVDGAFMAHLTETVSKVNVLAITDAASHQAASDLLGELTKAGTDLEEARVKLTAPFLKIQRQIMATAKTPNDAIEGTKAKLKRIIADYENIQAARARAAEATRLAELARLEEEKRKQEKEIERKAEELAASVSNEIEFADLDFEEDVVAPVKTEIDKKIEAVKFAPVVKQQKATGVRSTVVLRFIVSDVNLLPDQFVIRTANERLIRETCCKGWKEGEPIPSVPGVKFETQREIASSGRSNKPEIF